MNTNTRLGTKSLNYSQPEKNYVEPFKLIREVKEFDDDQVYAIEKTYHIRDQLYAKIETDLDGYDSITLDELHEDTKKTSTIILDNSELRKLYFTTKKLRDKLNEGEIK